MTVLVTGGCGYIGSHIVHSLHDASQAVGVMDDLRTGHRVSIPLDVRLVSGDIGRGDLFQDALRIMKPDTIIHCAASSIVEESAHMPMMYWHNNCTVLQTILDRMILFPAQNLIFCSSASVYGETVGRAKETDPLNPVNVYGQTKRSGEEIIHSASMAHGFNYVILRFFNVAGADPAQRTGESHDKATHLVKVAARAAVNKIVPMQLYGTDYDTPDGTCVRDYVHPTDIAIACHAAMDLMRGNSRVREIFNVGYGRAYSNREVIEEMKNVSGIDFPVMNAPRRQGDPAYLVADHSKIGRVLKWTPKHHTLTHICKTALEWERRLGLGARRKQ